jgi:predicted metal-dependent phosphoesterase TrpH
MKKFCCILTIIGIFSLISSANANSLVNPFTTSGNWYKANLHTHTTLSDGDVNLPIRVKQYRDRGYQVLAVTDHEKTNQITGYSDPNFLLLNGMETHPRSNSQIPYHFVCLNIPEGLKFTADVNAAERIRQVKAGGGEIIFAHPYGAGHTINDMLAVDGYIAMEVYNGKFSYTGKGYNSVQWDQLLNAGRIIPAVANDDLHNSALIGQSWTMIKAKELSPKAIMEALRTGCCYASCGPAFEDFRVEAGTAAVKSSPVVEICFMGQNTFSHNVTADPNHLITTAKYKLPEKIRWVRAEIVDANGRHAWTNPIVIEEPNKN